MIKHHEMTHFKINYIQATTVSVEDKNGDINISFIYCPPKHFTTITEHQCDQYLNSLGECYMTGGYWNAKQ